MKTKMLMLFTVLSMGLAAQNYVVNGTDWEDSDSDGLADDWYCASGNDPMIDGGAQFVASPGVPILGQVVAIPNPQGRMFRIQFEINSPEITQFIIWVSPFFSYVQSQPNPQPPGAWQYDFQFTYTQPEIYAIEFKALHYNTWMKLDNVSLTEVFPVCVPDRVVQDNTEPEYYNMIGERLPRVPDEGYYLKRVGRKVTKHYIR